MAHQKLSLPHPGQQRFAQTSANVCRVREIATEHEASNQPTSTRRLALAMRAEGRDVSHMTVYRILKDEGFRGYHERHVHELKPEDYPRRVQMAESVTNDG